MGIPGGSIIRPAVSGAILYKKGIKGTLDSYRKYLYTGCVFRNELATMRNIIFFCEFARIICYIHGPAFRAFFRGVRAIFSEPPDV